MKPASLTNWSMELVNAIHPEAKQIDCFLSTVMKCLQITRLCFDIVKFNGYCMEKFFNEFFLLRNEIYKFFIS